MSGFIGNANHFKRIYDWNIEAQQALNQVASTAYVESLLPSSFSISRAKSCQYCRQTSIGITCKQCGAPRD